MWSATSTWSGGVLPANGDDIQVVAGDTLVVNQDDSGNSDVYAGIEVLGTLDLDPGSATDAYIRLSTHPDATNAASGYRGAILAPLTGSDIVGRVICGTSLTNGMSLDRTAHVVLVGDNVNDNLFKNDNSWQTSGRFLDVQVFDGYGDIVRYVEGNTLYAGGGNPPEGQVKELSASGPTQLSITAGYLIEGLSTGAQTTACIVTATANRSSATCTDITDNGDDTYTYTIEGYTSGIRNTIFTLWGNGNGLEGNMPVVVCFTHSNLIFEGDTTTGAPFVTKSCKGWTLSARFLNFTTVIGSGPFHASRGAVYGACDQVPAPISLGSGNLMAATCTGGAIGNADTTGTAVIDASKDHTLGVSGGNAIFTGYSAAVGFGSVDPGAHTVYGKLVNIGALIATTHAYNAGHQLRLIDAEINNVNFYQASAANRFLFREIRPDIVKNVSFNRICQFWEAITNQYDQMAMLPQEWENVTISKVYDGGAASSTDTLDPFANLADGDQGNWMGSASAITIENLTLHGTQYDYYLHPQADKVNIGGVGIAYTIASRTGFTGSLEQMDFYSGRGQLYTQRKFYLAAGQSVSCTYAAEIPTGTDLKLVPYFSIRKADKGYMYAGQPETLEADGQAEYTDGFHDGTLDDIQSGSYTFTATNAGYYYATVACKTNGLADYGAGNTESVYAQLTATVASSGGGGGIIQSMTNSMVA